MSERLQKKITKRSDGRYMSTFQYCGERYTVYGKTSSECKKKLNDLTYELTHGLYVKPQNMTVDAWFEEWIEIYKKPTVKLPTIKRYINAYENHISPVIGKRKVQDIQSQTLQKLLNDLHEQGIDATMKLVFIVLKGIFDQALKNQMMQRDIIKPLTLPKVEETTQDDRRVMTKAEQALFMDVAADSGYYDIYLTLLQTGMRINEVCGLEWKDIDFTAKEIHVTGTLVYLRGIKRYKGTPKSSTSRRTIPLLPGVERVLRHRRAEQFENRVALGEMYKIEEGLEDICFTYPSGGAIWADTLRNDLRAIIKRIREINPDFEPITPHTLRHTFATRCAEQGMPLQVLKTILGHKSLAMTADLYSHVLPDTKREEMEKIIKLFG